MSPYGERWRSISGLVHQNLSCPGGAVSIHELQVVPAVERLIHRLAGVADTGVPVNMDQTIEDLGWDITFSVMFGSDPNDPPEYETLKTVMRRDTEWAERAAIQLSLGDLIPSLDFVPDHHVKRAGRQKTVRNQTLQRLFDIVRNRPSFAGDEPSCIMDSMLKQRADLSELAIEASCTDLAGFRIPRGAQVLDNLHAIHHDDRCWNEPEIYSPELFLEHNRSKAYRTAYTPFGTGIRICPGQHLVRMATWTAATRIIRTLPEREVFGLTLTPKPYFLLITRKTNITR